MKALCCALALVAAPALAQNQMQLSQQAAADAARADAEMNVRYRAAMAEMKRKDALHAPDAGPGPTYQAALLASQRAWLKFRDAECLVEGYRYRGGSARPMEAARCQATVTRQRTAQFTILATPLQ